MVSELSTPASTIPELAGSSGGGYSGWRMFSIPEHHGAYTLPAAPSLPIARPKKQVPHGARAKKQPPRGRSLAPVEKLPLDEVEFMRESSVRGEVRRSAG